MRVSYLRMCVLRRKSSLIRKFYSYTKALVYMEVFTFAKALIYTEIFLIWKPLLIRKSLLTRKPLFILKSFLISNFLCIRKSLLERNLAFPDLNMSNPNGSRIVWVSSHLLACKNQKPETETSFIQRFRRIFKHHENHICARSFDLCSHLYFSGLGHTSPAIEKCHRLVPARERMCGPVQLPGSKVEFTCIHSKPLAVAVAVTFAFTFPSVPD